MENTDDPQASRRTPARCKMCGAPLAEKQHYFCSDRCAWSYEARLRRPSPPGPSCRTCAGAISWTVDEE
ncbi:MAG: hypothetical protein QMD46_01195 [Methanomicrobiales archaeon]|nr:hypothetical protein [Methanomicrobiales archaeon]MDI6875711.1 hypothetical protein [Methanomicrobiales archaeon]